MRFKNKNQVITALITPFTENNEIDFDALTNLIEFQINNQVDALLILGTTAESSTLSDQEKTDVITHCLKIIRQRVPVIMGVGSNCTKTTIENHKKAKLLGVDASLIVTPYYNNPSSNDIYHHFKAIHDSIDFPFILYHVPSRTNSKLNILDAKKILLLENCIGMKDATGDPSWKSLIGIPNKLMYSGDDCSAYDYCQSGGDGVISVFSNLSPIGMKTLLLNNSDFYKNQCAAITCDTNPIPIKWLLKRYKLIREDNVRMPLQKLRIEYQSELAKVFLEPSLTTK
ncbi:MAG: 4-hydroxy-tetrahydrodipicolinate synthase [Pseudomonadota bacterium]|nr:4-hydroxy-tetrahydrodipicolinate synthase [Pseudomonadota bacterium]